MLRIEEPEFEKHVLSGECRIALPIEVSLGKSLDVTVYPMFSSVASEYIEKYSSDPFSAEATEFLREKIAPAMAELCYSVNAAKIYRDYRMTEKSEKSGEECEIISSLDGEESDISSLGEFELDESDPADRMAVIRRAGKIVCYAAVNDISEEDGCIEITVECDKEWRKNGFGKAAVCALSDYLLSLGENVKYFCAEENAASVKTAESAGFVLEKRTLPFVCCRNENED